MRNLINLASVLLIAATPLYCATLGQYLTDNARISFGTQRFKVGNEAFLLGLLVTGVGGLTGAAYLQSLKDTEVA